MLTNIHGLPNEPLPPLTGDGLLEDIVADLGHGHYLVVGESKSASVVDTCVEQVCAEGRRSYHATQRKQSKTHLLLTLIH